MDEDGEDDVISPMKQRRGSKEHGDHDATKHGYPHREIWMPWVLTHKIDESKSWKQAKGRKMGCPMASCEAEIPKAEIN